MFVLFKRHKLYQKFCAVYKNWGTNGRVSDCEELVDNNLVSRFVINYVYTKI